MLLLIILIAAPCTEATNKLIAYAINIIRTTCALLIVQIDRTADGCTIIVHVRIAYIPGRWLNKLQPRDLLVDDVAILLCCWMFECFKSPRSYGHDNVFHLFFTTLRSMFQNQLPYVCTPTVGNIRRVSPPIWTLNDPYVSVQSDEWCQYVISSVSKSSRPFDPTRYTIL